MSVRTVVQAGDLFSKYFPLEAYLEQLKHCPHIQKVYPDFPIQVLVVKDIPPRHEMFELERDFGSGFLEDIMEMRSLPAGKLLFYFPERWLSVEEQRLFMWAIMANPTRKKITLLQLLTSSPMMVSDFHREMIMVISRPEVRSEAAKASTENRDPKPSKQHGKRS